MLPPEHLIGIEPVREREITAEKLAVNAVMAGCLPMHFPVVVAAFTAMLQEPFMLHGPTASTGGCAILIVVNGPIRDELGMSGGFNALAASDRATTVIGRAIRLIVCNLLDARPGDVDRSTLGHPGTIARRLSACRTVTWNCAARTAPVIRICSPPRLSARDWMAFRTRWTPASRST